MAKILMIGVFKDGSGYSNAAINYLYAMDAVGLDVAARNIKLNNHQPEPNELVAKYLAKPIHNPDVVILHTLPTFFERQYNARYIGMFALEASPCPRDWANKCNLMDEIWVFCQHNKEACLQGGVKVPIKVIPHALDLDKYKKERKPTSIRQDFPNDFIFYFVGELNERKNIEALLKAFHTEFRKSEPVQLLLKVNVPGKSPQETAQILKQLEVDVKNGLRLYPRIEDYKVELNVVDRLTDEALLHIHNDCNCFVSTTRGEAFMYPLFDALAFNKEVIVPQHTSFVDIDYTKIVRQSYNCYPTICYKSNTVENLQSATQTWYEPDIIHLIQCMRRSFMNKGQKINNDLSEYSYESIGNKIKGCLNEAS